MNPLSTHFVCCALRCGMTAACAWLATSQTPVLGQTTLLSSTEVNRWLAISSLPAEGWNDDLGHDTSGWIVPQATLNCGLPSPYLCIWHSGDICGSGPPLVWFRATFDLTTMPESISLCAGVDDDIDVHVNGQLVLSDHNCVSNTACPASTIDILPYVVVGTNLVAIAGDDCAGGCYAMWSAVQATFPICVPGMPADMDCNCAVDLDDVAPFVLALISPAAYQAQFPKCDLQSADMNNDALHDGADVQGFAVALTQS